MSLPRAFVRKISFSFSQCALAHELFKLKVKKLILLRTKARPGRVAVDNLKKMSLAAACLQEIAKNFQAFLVREFFSLLSYE